MSEKPYHYNDINFVFPLIDRERLSFHRDRTKVQYNYFNCTGLSIPSGQDPKTFNKVGLTYPIDVVENGWEGLLEFQVGQHSDKDVAKWWTQHINNNETTFNKKPDALHFAFQGDLTLMIDSTRNTDHLGAVFVFKNVFLAQGYDGANNWWFGIKGAQNVGGNTIEIMANPTGPTSYKYKFHFQRGGAGDPVDQISITKIEAQLL